LDFHADFKESDELEFGSHMYHSLKDDIFSHLYCLGQQTREPDESNQHKTFTKDLDLAKEINGKVMHLTTDLDVIHAPYVDYHYCGGSFKFEELLTCVNSLAKNNTIVALDIFGAAPFYCWDFDYHYCYLPQPDGRWKQTHGWNLVDNKSRFVEPQEVKKIAPSFDLAVNHYAQLIAAVI